ncbi:MAG: hypothetical protein QOE39_4264, partial [Bradyrhizobium sp.]|nr:hypothetical protein [Bradyrhizobium sp.]
MMRAPGDMYAPGDAGRDVVTMAAISGVPYDAVTARPPRGRSLSSRTFRA